MIRAFPKPVKKEKKLPKGLWIGGRFISLPVAKKSDKRSKEDVIYAKAKREYLFDHPKCECECGQKSTEIHHKAHVRYGRFLYDKFQFMAVARPCHVKIHNNVAESIEKGFLFDSETKHKYLRGEIGELKP